MKFAKDEQERCLDTFEVEGIVRRCTRIIGHHGKHLSTDDCCAGWTDGVKAKMARDEVKRLKVASTERAVTFLGFGSGRVAPNDFEQQHWEK